MPENQEAWHLWSLVSTQWRVGAFSLVGLDYPAVFQVAELYGYDVNPAMMRKIKALEMYEISEFSKKGGEGSGK